jgi:hypothetical protein
VETSALIIMIVGMIIIWGGLAASIAWAIKVARSTADEPPADVDTTDAAR